VMCGFRSCPQFDATQATLTGREHLHLYARLRGVRPAARRIAMVNRLLTQVCVCMYVRESSRPSCRSGTWLAPGLGLASPYPTQLKPH
jgi:hypothetical protein